MSHRVVIIGAGIGGLAAALRLAHAGCEVTVLDRAAAPGGKMRVVDSAAGPVDAGPTVLTMRPVFEALFESVGETLSDHITLVPETVLARHWWADGTTLDLFADPDASAAAVRDLAGARGEAEFRRFCARAARLFAAFDGPMMQDPSPDLLSLGRRVLREPGLVPAMAPGRSLAGLLAGAFTDPRLRQLFGRYATYVGGSPYRSPALLALIWQAERGGVWRVQGGMHRLALALAALAGHKGARLRHGAEVSAIETSADGSVSGVRLAGGEAIAADRVVFNGDPRALHLGMLGDRVRQAVPRGAVEPRSLSAFVWSFAAVPQGPALAHHNVFFGRDPRAEFDDLAAGRMPADPMLYVCAQDRGTGTATTGAERFEIIMNAPPCRDGAAEAQREAETCRTLTFATLDRFGLRFDAVPGTDRLTTPARFAALFPGSAGSLYGQSPHGMTASLRKPRARSAVPGLYLAGGGVHPGAGIPMAALSGRHAAEAILSDLASTLRSPRTAMPGGMSTA